MATHCQDRPHCSQSVGFGEEEEQIRKADCCEEGSLALASEAGGLNHMNAWECRSRGGWLVGLGGQQALNVIKRPPPQNNKVEE